MYIAELEYNNVICFESKRQYSFAPNQVLFTYENYLPLNCDFETAIKNSEIIKKAAEFMDRRDLCGGDIVREKIVRNKLIGS